MSRYDFQWRYISHQGDQYGGILKWLKQLPSEQAKSSIKLALSSYWSAIAAHIEGSAQTTVVHLAHESQLILTERIEQIQKDYEIAHQVVENLPSLELGETIQFFYRYQPQKEAAVFRFLNQNKGSILTKEQKFLIPLQAFWEVNALQDLNLAECQMLSQYAARSIRQLANQINYLDKLLTFSVDLPDTQPEKGLFLEPKLAEKAPQKPRVYPVDDLVMNFN